MVSEIHESTVARAARPTGIDAGAAVPLKVGSTPPKRD
jgi:hypothetical protein